MAESVELVTILLTDLVDSTRLANSVGPVRSDQLHDEHFELLRDAIASAGGREVKNTGDGLMVAFPSASAGVQCAVTMQQLFERRSRTAEHSLQLRIGLGAGESTFKEGDYFGMPAIEAARLCARAPTDGILVSGAVKMLAGRCEGVEFVSVGELELKGFPELVQAFSVSWSPAGEDTFALPALIEAGWARGFAARQTERAQLAAALVAAEAGARQVVLISGEPGIGKTALATELAIEAHGRGLPVLYGRCEEDAARPYEPFVEALEHLIAHCPQGLIRRHLAAHGDELARIVPALATRAPEAQRAHTADPVSERYALFDAVADILARAAEDSPLLVLLDDLHWAEHSTLQLLRHLSGQLGSAAVVLIGTYRSSELGGGHPLVSLLADLHREPAITRIELSGLDEQDVVALMEILAGHELDERGEQLAGVLRRETSGNPFFIRELLSNLTETGALKRTGGRWSGDPGVALPASVREVVLRRVERLGEYARDALVMGAIIGREFDAELLVRALDTDEDALADALDGAVGAGLLRELPDRGGHFEFAHALVEYALYESIGPARRRRGHHRVAGAIEEICAGRTESRVAELAYHFGEAASSADVAKAVAYATLAGDRSLEQLAPDDGVGWYEQALRMQADAPGAGDEERCDLLIRLGRAQALAGLSQQRETLFEAAELARRLSDSGRLVRSALANERGRLYSEPGHVDLERVEVLEDALAAVGSVDSPERAELLARLSDELQFAGDPARRLALSDEALAVVRRLDAPESLVSVVAERAIAIFSPDTLQTRRAEAEEAVAASRRIGDPLARYHALRCRVLAAICAADVKRAQEDLAEAQALARRTAHPVAHWFTSMMCCTMSALLGRLDEADGFAEEGFEFASASGQPDAEFVRFSQLAPIRYDQGRMQEMQPVWEVLARELPGVPACLGVLTLAETESGMDDGAREHLQAGARAGFAPMDIAWGAAVGSYAIAAARQGDRESAAALYPLLAPYEDQVAYTAANAWLTIAHHLGALARVGGRLELAERHLVVAAQLGERMGAPLWLARTHVEQARVRMLRGAAASELVPALESARETALRLGAPGLDREAAELLDERESIAS